MSKSTDDFYNDADTEKSFISNVLAREHSATKYSPHKALSTF
jgi:hypothetical protein